MEKQTELTFLLICKQSNQVSGFTSLLKQSLPKSKIILANSHNEASALLGQIAFDMVFLDISIKIAPSKLEQLKSNIVVNFIPILLIGANPNKDTIAWQYNMSYVNGFLDINADTITIQNTINRLIPITKFGSKTDMIMTNIIRAFLKKAKAQEYSLSMVTKALIVSKHFSLSKQELFACTSALKYLSAFISSDESYKEALSFFKELKLSNRTNEILLEIKRPLTPAGKIACCIFNTMLNAKENKRLDDFEDAASIEPEYLTLVAKLFNSYAVYLQSGYDIEMIMERVISLFISLNIKKNSEKFLDHSALFLTKILLFCNGGIVQTSFDDKSIRIQIEPFFFDSLLLNKDANEHTHENISFYCDEQAKVVVLTISSSDMDDSFIQVDDSIFLFPEEAYSDTSAEHEKLSASLFFSNGHHDGLDMESLVDVIDELNELVHEYELNQNSFEFSLKIVKNLKRFAVTILAVDAFNNIADAIEQLGDEIQEAYNNSIPSGKVILTTKLLILLIEDLNNWYGTIFVNKSATDIHFLDSSIVTSCRQAIHLFYNKE